MGLGGRPLGTFACAGTIPVSDAEVTPEQVADGIDAFDFLVTGARVDDDRRVDRYVVGLSE